MSDLVNRLRKRAQIRRNIPTRKSVQEGVSDRISDLLEESANEISRLRIGLNKISSIDSMYGEKNLETANWWINTRNPSAMAHFCAFACKTANDALGEKS